MLIAHNRRKDEFSKVQQIFKYLNARGSIPEGLCFETVFDDIIKLTNVLILTLSTSQIDGLVSLIGILIMMEQLLFNIQPLRLRKFNKQVLRFLHILCTINTKVILRTSNKCMVNQQHQ